MKQLGNTLLHFAHLKETCFLLSQHIINERTVALETQHFIILYPDIQLVSGQNEFDFHGTMMTSNGCNSSNSIL